MGIINRGRPDGGQHAGTTVIAAGSKLVGDLALSDNLHVDGQIEGKVRSEAEVAIGQSGRMEGELQAEHVMISGSFEGNIDARRLEIVAGGRVNGDVTVAELVIEPGALFNGNSRIRETEASSARAGESRTKPSASDKPEPEETRGERTAAKAG
jgi:cytoskeletal protein CcmA (bactofilin family)